MQLLSCEFVKQALALISSYQATRILEQPRDERLANLERFASGALRVVRVSGCEAGRSTCLN